ncbi:MAG: TerB family tellurite resistance protein, partial [Cyanobacteriota bacterium]
MDTSLVSSEAVDLLSRITGQKLRKQDLTPPVIFLAALITVLLGVMLLDGAVTDEEKRRWQQTINRFIPSEDARQLSQLMSKGVRQNQVYKKLNELLMLTAPFSESERLLLIGFGYEMSAADGDMDAREKKYLEVIANRLEINPQHLAVLETGFSHQGTVEPAALEEVQSLLDPARFHALDAVFIKAANDMLAVLP